MNENELSPQPQPEPQYVERAGETLGHYTAQAFLWMALGLMVTFGVSILAYVTLLPVYLLVYTGTTGLIVLTIVELIVVIVLSAKL